MTKSPFGRSSHHDWLVAVQLELQVASQAQVNTKEGWSRCWPLVCSSSPTKAGLVQVWRCDGSSTVLMHCGGGSGSVGTGTDPFEGGGAGAGIIQASSPKFRVT